MMVAITVILGAVIGTFVLDMGQDAGNPAPSASITVGANPGGDGGTGTIVLAHEGGDGLDARRTRVVITNTSGATVTFDPNSTSSILRVGAVATYRTNGTGPDTLDWSGDGTTDWVATTGGLADISTGDQLTVRLIDTDSQRVIYETTVTA